jgi:hypothetical protein
MVRELALNPGSRRSHRRRNAIYSARRALVVLTPPHFGEGLPCLGKWPPLIAFNDPAILQPFSSFFTIPSQRSHSLTAKLSFSILNWSCVRLVQAAASQSLHKHKHTLYTVACRHFCWHMQYSRTRPDMRHPSPSANGQPFFYMIQDCGRGYVLLLPWVDTQEILRLARAGGMSMGRVVVLHEGRVSVGDVQ